MNNYEWLLARLDAFIRRYYANQLLRGGLMLLICTLFFVLTVSIGEYYLYLPSWIRMLLVTFFICAGIAALVIWIIIPLAKMTRLRKGMAYEDAARIIGTHFPEISDRLLNMLQLKQQENTTASRELIAAGIAQKAARISVVPITAAVNFSRNRKYLRYLIPLVLIAVVILVFSPSIFIDASQRLLQPARSFERPAPFEFIIKTDPLQVVRGHDFVLEVAVSGRQLPADMFVAAGSELLYMTAGEGYTFRYAFRNVTEPLHFRLQAAGFRSQEYTLKIVQQPALKGFTVTIDYPGYTGKQDEVIHSLGDLTVPAGTMLRWDLTTEFTDVVALQFGAEAGKEMSRKGNTFSATARMLQDTVYTLSLVNHASGMKQAHSYRVQVIADQHPVLQMQEFRDSVSGTQVLLSGIAGDDYGVSRVMFHYTVADAQNQSLNHQSLSLSIQQPGLLTAFRHYFDIAALALQPGQKLSYYIEAWDNDAVHGSKSVRSEVMTWHMYDEAQLDSALYSRSEQINSSLSHTAQQAKRMLEELTEMQHKMLQQDKPGWEQQQSVIEMSERQEQLSQQLENIKKRFEEQVQQSKQKEYSEDLREKQEELKKQMDNLLDNELQEQMKRLEELMKKLNRDNAFQTMQQMEQENKLFNMNLERMQELMKQLEMQMRMEDMANKMEDLAGRQLDLKQATEEQKQGNEALGKEQEALKNELEQALQEDGKALKELNEQLQRPQQLDNISQQGKDAKDQMQQSGEELKQQQNEKSGAAQQQAADNLQQMASALRSAAGGMDIEQIEIDIKAVRQLLTNLIRLSFDQEGLMAAVQETSPSSQAYLKNQQEQNRLHRNSRMIRDSLFTLSKRMFKLAATINKETAAMEQHMKAALTAIESRNTGIAVTRQQFVMTHTNNLALMLNETLSNLMQMQSQAMQESDKEGNCSNPGGKKPKPGAGQQLSDIITQQQELGDAMQQMNDAQQKRAGGKKPGGEEGKEQGQQQGGRQEGGSSGSGEGRQDGGEYGNAEQLARMARQQAMLRKQLQELQSLLNSKGLSGNAATLKEIQENMDKTETDLVNRRLSQELIQRQRAILTRLLETEKAVREQEQDDQRSARNAGTISRPIPSELSRHIRERESLLERYKTAPPQLNPYYRTMVTEYYRLINSGER